MERRSVFSLSLDEMELTIRVANCLKARGLKTVADLVQMTDAEVLRTQGVGMTALREIKRVLADMGLRLGLVLEDEMSMDFVQATEELAAAAKEWHDLKDLEERIINAKARYNDARIRLKRFL